jgi:hypothetical protein
MPEKIPKPPSGARAGGIRLWNSVLSEYLLEEHEMALLVEAVRLVDVLDALDRVIRFEGVLHDSPQGVRAHPAVVESRQQKIALARLLAALRLPAGEEDAGQTRRPQRRVGVRGTYQLRGVK